MTPDPILRRLARNPEYDRLCARLLLLLWEKDRAVFVPYSDAPDDLSAPDSLTARFGCGPSVLRPVPDFFDLERDEQLVVMEVCRLPGMTAEYWASLDPFSREPWVGRAVAELERCPTPPETRDQPTPIPAPPPASTIPPTLLKAGKRGKNWDAPAVAVFLDHPDWTVKQIAEHLGCNVKSLAPARCPKLKAARQATKHGSMPPRGSKSKDGRLEAKSDDE